MSPRVPVLSLGFICVKFLSNRLIEILSCDEISYSQTTRDYLSDVTYEVLQELLENILNSTTLDAATRFNCLEVLLRNDIKRLNTGMFPHSYYEKILKVIVLNGTGLQKVNLKGVWARDHPVLLSELVSSLNNLKVLIIPHMANDAVLQCVSSCKHLNILDISGEACFTAEGLDCLKNESLQILDIGNYGKREVCEGNSDDTEVIASLIYNLPSLKSLRTYCYTGTSLLLLRDPKTNRTTNLTFLHDSGTTNEIFTAISEFCPNLESIHLDSPEEGVILRLQELRRLSCLKLTKPINNELTEYVLSFGSNLEIMKINHNRRQRLELADIASGAPRVQTLEFYQMHLTFNKEDVFFMFLKNIEILYCDISDNCLKQILTNCPFLRRILVGSIINFTDGDVFRLCAECDFEFLEELWFSCARGLTIISVELLMGHCPNLRLIGQMSGWDVTSEELEFFKSVIQASNIDLTLLPLVV